jgi:hypothetical protein
MRALHARANIQKKVQYTIFQDISMEDRDKLYGAKDKDGASKGGIQPTTVNRRSSHRRCQETKTEVNLAWENLIMSPEASI